MSFQPVVLGSGLAGWQFLKATREAQQTAFANSSSVQRNLDLFRTASRSEDPATTVLDGRQARLVALTAFGLAEDLDNRFFIERVATENPAQDEAFSNRLADKRYRGLATAFAGLTGPQPLREAQIANIEARFISESFAAAVGESDGDLRLALQFSDQLNEIISTVNGDEARWLTVLGTPTLRAVFESALGLPTAVGTLDLDQQLEVFQDKTRNRVGSSDLAELAQPELTDRMIDLFLLQRTVTNSTSLSGASAALALLQA